MGTYFGALHDSEQSLTLELRLIIVFFTSLGWTRLGLPLV